jgi:hypothetical protein
MWRSIIMLVASLLVAGAMALTFILCKRRLDKIEDELWGKKEKKK